MKHFCYRSLNMLLQRHCQHHWWSQRCHQQVHLGAGRNWLHPAWGWLLVPSTKATPAALPSSPTTKTSPRKPNTQYGHVYWRRQNVKWRTCKKSVLSTAIPYESVTRGAKYLNEGCHHMSLNLFSAVLALPSSVQAEWYLVSEGIRCQDKG